VADAAGPRAVGLLGVGVIGAGWAARFLLHGVDVRVFDPDPGAGEHAARAVDNARRAYETLLTAPLPAPGDLTVAASAEEAADGADFVQESVPEREELKRALLAAAGSVTPAGVVIVNSPAEDVIASLEFAERLMLGAVLLEQPATVISATTNGTSDAIVRRKPSGTRLT